MVCFPLPWVFHPPFKLCHSLKTHPASWGLKLAPIMAGQRFRPTTAMIPPFTLRLPQAPVLPDTMKQARNRGTQGVQERHNVELPPLISNVWPSNRPNMDERVACFSYMGVRQRSGEGVVQRNGCPKGCFWRFRFFSAPLRFSDVLRANLEGAEKNRTAKKTLLDAFSAPLARSDLGPFWPLTDYKLEEGKRPPPPRFQPY